MFLFCPTPKISVGVTDKFLRQLETCDDWRDSGFLVSRLQEFGSSSPSACRSISGGISAVLYFFNEFIFWVFKYLSTELGDESNLGETLTQSSGEICLPSLRDRQWSGLIAAGREESSDQRQHEFGGIDWK